MTLTDSPAWQRALARAIARGIRVRLVSRTQHGWAETIRYEATSHSRPGTTHAVAVRCDGAGVRVWCSCPGNRGACQHAAAALAHLGLLSEDAPAPDGAVGAPVERVDGAAVLARYRAAVAEDEAALACR